MKHYVRVSAVVILCLMVDSTSVNSYFAVH